MRTYGLWTRWTRFLPIVERELRIAARGQGVYRWRTGAAAIGLVFMALVTTTQAARNTRTQDQALWLFFALVTVSALYAFLGSVAVTADAVSREKREGTLGLLFLTDLRGRDIVVGKLAANSLNTIYGLLGFLPLLAIPVMMGGISVGSGVSAALSVLNLLFVSLSLGIFISTISWNERRATFAAIVTGLTVMLLPPFFGGVQAPAGFLITHVSPLVPLLESLPGLGPSWTVLDLVPSHVVGWLLLSRASVMAQAAWHSRSGSPVRRTVDERIFTPREPKARLAHRRRTLRLHPLVWLLERHPAKRYYADGLVLSIIAIWLWSYRVEGAGMFGGPGWYLVAPLALTVHLILASWVVAETSMRLLEDRRSGALELLLCTSLSDREIIRGHRLVLRRLFLRPVLLLVVAEILVAFVGFGSEDDAGTRNGRWMMLALALAVALDTQALSWISLRLAVSLPNVNRVGALALAITPLGPMLLAGIVISALILTNQGGRSMTFPMVLMIWLSMVVLVDLVVGQGLCRRSVLRHFRAFAVRVQPRAAVAS